ncbi:hypothetical protein BK138_08565 [Paenibacillus rhizosphaerae]|uniref:Uncharacterized protein n=1 Tax=Paenibacillus rhizosphaerae TaxID=297318 RepID=A0A1R1F3A5_9BACL|nr:hypothetical protein [Paenibacillus rhizosphaerae]OMF58553.1 hypothetical protein BK138_08565 [Paenibacillus rhizosphaerae]
MKPIKLNPTQDVKEGTYLELAWLVPDDEQRAVTTDGFFVSLVEVVPDPDRKGEYKPAREYEYTPIAIDDKRSVEGIKEIIQTLQAMTAYEMITKHFNEQWGTFFVNRDKNYVAGYGEDAEHDPIGLSGERQDRDY